MRLPSTISAVNRTVTIAAGGVSPASVVFRNAAYVYTIQGGPIAGGGGLQLEGGGTVNLKNSNTYTGETVVENNSTLKLSNTTALNPASTVILYDTSTLQFNVAMTFSNAVSFNAGSAGVGASPIISTGSFNVQMTGVVYSGMYSNNATIGFTKMGTGQLLLTDPYNNDTGTTLIDQGTICVNTVDSGTGYSYSALGSGNIKIQGGTLYLDNVNIGVNQNQTLSNLVGYVDLYTGSTLKGSGNASYQNNSIRAVLNYGGGGYQVGSGTLATTGSGDTLTLMNAVRQYDPNYPTNEYGNWVGNGAHRIRRSDQALHHARYGRRRGETPKWRRVC